MITVCFTEGRLWHNTVPVLSLCYPDPGLLIGLSETQLKEVALKQLVAVMGMHLAVSQC